MDCEALMANLRRRDITYYKKTLLVLCTLVFLDDAIDLLVLELPLFFFNLITQILDRSRRVCLAKRIVSSHAFLVRTTWAIHGTLWSVLRFDPHHARACDRALVGWGAFLPGALDGAGHPVRCVTLWRHDLRPRPSFNG